MTAVSGSCDRNTAVSGVVLCNGYDHVVVHVRYYE